MNLREVPTVLALYEAGNALSLTLRYLLMDRLRPKYLGHASIDHAAGAAVVSSLFAVLAFTL